MVDHVKFEVLGSRGFLFEVRFWLTEDGAFRSFCTCESGFQLVHCVHRMDILEGNLSAVTHNVPEGDKKFIVEALAKSESGRLLGEVQAIKTEIAEARKRLRIAHERFDREFCRMPFRE